ncbi:MAG: hydrogenase maturation nickel metallochaperone HypA [bacterium]
MHELAIANSIFETVMQEMQARKISSVKQVGIQIGVLSCVDAESLRFNFEVITSQTPLSQTRLEIENVAVQGVCRDCAHDFEVHDFVFACPNCHSGHIQVTKGEELQIVYLEVDDESFTC